ncbi:hypothetical protein B9Z55_017962 [Caenorhabditis nigoni]|nr:hypothetical protein B9Z55_017962 [Caenorhabditis nigoni]
MCDVFSLCEKIVIFDTLKSSEISLKHAEKIGGHLDKQSEIVILKDLGRHPDEQTLGGQICVFNKEIFIKIEQEHNFKNRKKSRRNEIEEHET